MKISDIDKNIKMVDMENFFNVAEKNDGIVNPYVYNLNETVYLYGARLQSMEVSHDTFWTTLSYQIYGTTRLWWLLMKVNNVKPDSSFSPVRASETVFYIQKDEVASILKMGLM